MTFVCGLLVLAPTYVGFFADSDIGPRDGNAVAGDDMAGSFSGAVRASDNSWVPVEVGFMWDAAEDDRLDGYFGVAFLGHDIDPEGQRAPRTLGLRTFQRFSGTAPFDQGGDPTNDFERYEALSTAGVDPDAVVPADYRNLISVGPFAELAPGEEMSVAFVLVAGADLAEMVRNAGRARLVYEGLAFDRDGDPQNGNDDCRAGYECRQDNGTGFKSETM